MEDDLILHDNQPSRADALKNRALLLETARRLFDEQGVVAVSMTAIAEAAGVGKGTLYRHFENKSVLCHALLDQEMRDLQERSLRRLRNQGDPADDLRWFVRQIVTYVSQNAELLSDHAGLDPVAALDYPAHRWWRQTIRGLLERIAPFGDRDYMTDALYIMLDVRTLLFQSQTRGYTVARIESGLLDLLDRFIGS